MTKRKAWISLLLLIPAPSIGVLFGMILFPDTSLGKGVFIFSKIWMLLLPALWFFFAEGGTFPRGLTRDGGFRMGLLTGIAISGFVVGAAWLLGRTLIDGEFFKETMANVGLDRRGVYIGAAVYWVCINSILEEYVWRWFTVRQFATLLKPTAAIVASALGFTLHHLLAMQVYFSWPVAMLCSFFIFVGGMLWSWMFMRYNTIWPGWLSHALVDIAVFGAGYVLIFC
ncbi:MAG: CPBP family intramembrane metalloprotease [Verrucomicrobia bacterium]|nr:CPBP family intramembrane metalloprotease [Verrucomicrobiota bacterium]